MLFYVFSELRIDVRYLPVFSCLCGNDYISPESLDGFFQHISLNVKSCSSGAKFNKVIEYLTKSSLPVSQIPVTIAKLVCRDIFSQSSKKKKKPNAKKKKKGLTPSQTAFVKKFEEALAKYSILQTDFVTPRSKVTENPATSSFTPVDFSPNQKTNESPLSSPTPALPSPSPTPSPSFQELFKTGLILPALFGINPKLAEKKSEKKNDGEIPEKQGSENQEEGGGPNEEVKEDDNRSEKIQPNNHHWFPVLPLNKNVKFSVQNVLQVVFGNILKNIYFLTFRNNFEEKNLSDPTEAELDVVIYEHYPNGACAKVQIFF